MSMSDARQFAELSARVAELENKMGVVIAQIALAQADIYDHIEGKDVSEEVLGPVADEAARDGLRAMLKERRHQVAPGDVLLEGAGVAPLPGEGPSGGEADLPLDPGLKDRLAALQGGDAAQSANSTAQKPEPPKPGMRK